MNIQLSEHFTYKKLIRFTIPSIMMMIFTSIYGIVDGFFVSNFVGKTPFAAVNFIMPFLMILGAVGFMFGTGGSALVSKTMGEGKMKKAEEYFSLFVYVSLALGILIAVLGLVFIPWVAALLGASGEMLSNCVLYGRVILIALPAYMLQMEFQTFFITAEKPDLGFKITVIAGVTNMVLDALFVAVFHWGLVGAAAATAISQCIGGLVPLIYFFRPNSSLLRLTKTHFDGRALLQACSNGFSELISNISMSLVGMLYNVQLMTYAGENGIAAYGVIMYIDMIFFATFIGYSIGTAPIIGYHYGAGNEDELKSLLKKSFIMMGIASACMFIFAEVMTRPLAMIFASYDEALLALTIRGFRIYALSFLVVGIAIFGSSFFTALNNGFVSAAISFLRTIVFEVVFVLLIPKLFGIDGIWISIVLARLLAVAVTVFFLIKYRSKYHYY